MYWYAVVGPLALFCCKENAKVIVDKDLLCEIETNIFKKKTTAFISSLSFLLVLYPLCDKNLLLLAPSRSR